MESDHEENQVMELRFRMGDYFKENDVVGRWIVVLSIIVNDLNLSCELLNDLLEQGKNDASAIAKQFYCFRLACSHLREAIKWLDKSIKNSDIEKFIKSLDREASINLQDIKSLCNPFNGSFAVIVLQPVRHGFFHYPELNDRGLQGALRNLANHETSAFSETDIRFFYVDDLNVMMFGDIIDGSRLHNLESACKELAEAIFNFVNFGNSIIIPFLCKHKQIQKDRNSSV